MKKLLIIIFFVSITYSSEKNIKLISHYSNQLKKEQKLFAYIPDSNGPHSVLYLLHGAYGNYTDWNKLTDIKNYADKYNFIIVMPNGGEFSWYIDSPIRENWNYESYFIKELIPFIDSTFNTIKNKNGRAISGLSMGGFGAFHFALKYPDYFISATSLSGVLNTKKYAGKKPIADTSFGSITNKKFWDDNDLFLLIENKNLNINLFFDCGIDDKYIADNREFAIKLQQLKYPFRYAEKNGEHNWKYWNENISEHLEFHSNYLSNGKK